MDLFLTAIAALSAASLGIPFIQLKARRGKISGYLLILAVAAALGLIILNTVSPQQSTAFGSLISNDALGDLFAIVTLSVVLFVAVASLTIMPATNSPFYYSLLSFAASECSSSRTPPTFSCSSSPGSS